VSNHEIGLGRVLRADVTTVSLYLVPFAPYTLARFHHASWYWQWAGIAFGGVLLTLGLWALGRHTKWIGQTYRLAKGHAALSIADRDRSFLANAIAIMLAIPAFATMLLLPLLLQEMPWLAEPAPMVALTFAWILLLAIAIRSSVYYAVRIANRIRGQR
jgi:drug/metabolite transporter (DMT)-like permease